jgi:general secretion pathway protein G
MKQSKQKAGMTLIEIMIVLSIIASIAAVIGSTVIRQYGESQVTNTKNQIRALTNSLDEYRRICGMYPTTEQGLSALAAAPTSGRLCKNYGEPIIRRVPKDAWDNDFIYSSDGQKFEIKSLGADGVEGGTGNNADISSNDL